MATFTRRALMRTSAPIFRSLRRIVPHVAAASAVWASPIRRRAHRRTYAIEANHSRSWLARMLAAEVRSAKRSPWHSLIRFSISDAVLHLAPGTVEILIERPRSPLVGLERGHQKAWVRLASDPFRLGDHPSAARPRLLRGPEEVPEHTGGPTGRLSHGPGLLEGGRDAGLKPGIAGQAEHEVDAVLLAPEHERLAGKARVRPQHDLHPRPAGPDLAHNALNLLDGPGTRIDVGAAQLGGEKVPAAEDVQR